MSVYTKMTALADEVRELSGATDLLDIDEMTTHIGDANNEISTQIELIAQITQALEGKASGGNGSSAYEVKYGPMTYSSTPGGPLEAETYLLYANNIIITQTDITIAYVNETIEERVSPHELVVRTIPLVAVIGGGTYQLNTASYTVKCDGQMLAYSDHIKLENTSIDNTDKDTFNEFRYIAITRKQEAD